MKPITFYKMVASGNDFVVIDNRQKIVTKPVEFAKRVCPVHTAVGADGVLLIENSKRADYFLRIMNADGSEAEACGNGYRCVGLFAHEFLRAGKHIVFETLAGLIEVDVNGRGAIVRMARPTGFERDLELALNGRTLHMSFVNIGVPHAVIFAQDLEEVPVYELGRAVRYHARFQPRGTNVNFVRVEGRNELSVRTYERGVEDETLACGTGSVAAVVCSVLTDRVQAPVSVHTKSGEILKVNVTRQGDQIRDVFLEGGAKLVYEGKLALE